MTEEERERVLAAKKIREVIEKGLEEICELSRFELEVEEEKRALGQRTMDEKLARLKPEDGKPKACRRCGKRAKRRAIAQERTFKSLSGTHSFKRDYYWCEGCSHGFYPMDEFLGLPLKGDVTIELERRMADFAINDSYDVASERWNMHYPLQTSPNQFRQVIKRMGNKMDEADCNPTLLHSTLKPPCEIAPRILYVMNDGGMVPMRGEWKECKLACLFPEEKHLRGTLNNRGVIEQARYIAVLGAQEEFRKELQQALFVENTVRPDEIVWIADGAPGNWTLASILAPTATQILDWHHAIEHASNCGKILFGEGHICNELWRKEVQRLLMSNPEDALDELTKCLPLAQTAVERDAITSLVFYFETNKERMKYREYLERGLLIGSGVVESAHRHVIQTRMKKAGQHWSKHGGRQMARLRAAYKTTGAKTFYSKIHWASRYGPRVKKLPMFEKRRASNS